MLMNLRCWMGIRQRLFSHLSVLNKDVPSSLLFAIYLNNIDSVAEGVKGGLTGTPNYLVTHMLFVDNLFLMSNDPSHMQTMLKKLSKHKESC